MEKQNIRIKLRAYDNKILDASTEEIVNTVKISFLVGRGIGPFTWAPVLLAVLTISIVDKSKILLSYALKCIRIFCLLIKLR